MEHELAQWEAQLRAWIGLDECASFVQAAEQEGAATIAGKLLVIEAAAKMLRDSLDIELTIAVQLVATEQDI